MLLTEADASTLLAVPFVLNIAAVFQCKHVTSVHYSDQRSIISVTSDVLRTYDKHSHDIQRACCLSTTLVFCRSYCVLYVRLSFELLNEVFPALVALFNNIDVTLGFGALTTYWTGRCIYVTGMCIVYAVAEIYV